MISFTGKILIRKPSYVEIARCLENILKIEDKTSFLIYQEKILSSSCHQLVKNYFINF